MLLTKDDIKEKKILTPFLNKKVSCPLSYGPEPNGYTIRLSNRFLVPDSDQLLDPMKKNKIKLIELEADKIIIKPGEYILGKSIEYFKIPSNVTAVGFTKSSYARLGIFANIVAIDPLWEGYLTISIANLGKSPVILYANYGVATILFFEHKNTQGYSGNYQKLDDIKI